MMGLEPTTLGTTNRCSNQLSYIRRKATHRVSLRLCGRNRGNYSRKLPYELLCELNSASFADYINFDGPRILHRRFNFIGNVTGQAYSR